MRILVCLLSEQHVPNLLSVHHLRPNRLVLVETEKTKRDATAAHLLDALKRGGLDYSDRCDRVFVEHEDSVPEMIQVLAAAHARHPADDWIANVTGGNKPMSIAAYQFFHERNAPRVYINHAKPNVIQWMDGSRVETCGHRPTIAEFLAGYGFGFQPGRAPEDVAEPEARARDWWPCARALAAHALPEDLLSLPDNKERELARRKGLDVARRHWNDTKALDVEEVRDALARTFSLTVADGALSGRLNKHQVEFLTGGWLEVFVWGLLDSDQAALDVWDVRLGLLPTRHDQALKNDFDVAFMHRYGLCVVECKSGSQGHSPSADADIVYKIEAIRNQTHALHARTILATTADIARDPKTGGIKKEIEERARAYQCTLVPREQVRALATADDPVELIKQALRL